jgi:SAM-dependent methyltransferase
MRPSDGSAGDADYATIGKDYSRYRRAEPRIAALIVAALGNARTVVNVGAGAGSYEPEDREVTAVEPSAAMRAQRPAHRPAAIEAIAEKLPFPDRSFDAALATFTVHQWSNLGAGLAEMRRVTRGPVIILTCDPDQVRRFWLDEYAPEVLATEARRYPSMATIRDGLGTDLEIRPVPIPLACRDGFNEAYYGRPEALLDDGARLACSAWSFVDQGVTARALARLRSDLDTGVWDRKHGQLRTQGEFLGSLCLLVSRPGDR